MTIKIGLVSISDRASSGVYEDRGSREKIMRFMSATGG